MILSAYIDTAFDHTGVFGEKIDSSSVFDICTCVCPHVCRSPLMLLESFQSLTDPGGFLLFLSWTSVELSYYHLLS